jgi:hypothetical protein
VSDTVYLLWFVQERDEAKDTELLIGVYAAETDAIAAIDRLRNKPGSVDFPHGFQIHRGEIGQDSWTEGFVVV